VSFADERGFAAGFAADLDLGRAVRGALVELCQMELGLHVVAAKRRHGAALHDADLRQLRRAEAVSPGDLPARDGAPAPARPAGESVPESAGARLAALAGRLAQAGHAVHVVDLTRPGFAVPVARVLVPGLQIFPARPISSRFRRVAAENECGTPWARGIDLF
jgi:ribosomal protein S12 methylthiotransferase accessory factor